MDPLLLAIYIFIIITIIVTIQCVRRGRETLATTPEECGITGVVKLPYYPLNRFDFYPGKDSSGFADIRRETAGDANSPDLAVRHRYLAAKCDETPGCAAFISTGYLKSGVLIPSLRRTMTYPAPCSQSTCGLFVRKCARPEPRYTELYDAVDYGVSKNPRLLLPPGSYPELALAHRATGAVGGPMVNDGVKSMKVPSGLRTTLYVNKNYTDQNRKFGPGAYPRLNDYTTGRTWLQGDQKWGDSVTSLKVMPDI